MIQNQLSPLLHIHQQDHQLPLGLVDQVFLHLRPQAIQLGEGHYKSEINILLVYPWRRKYEQRKAAILFPNHPQLIYLSDDFSPCAVIG